MIYWATNSEMTVLFHRQDVVIPAFAQKLLAERTGLEPARAFSLDGLANRYGYRFVTSPKIKRVVGLEPTIKGFADLRLYPLGYTRDRKGGRMRDEG